MIKLFESSIEDNFFFAENIDARGFQKTAGIRELPDEADQAIRDLVRKPNHKYVLVSAMGDGETWGSNRNADYFPNKALTGTQGPHERINTQFGPRPRYKTFEDAHFFHHHKNKIELDPHFGYVPKSIWHPKMRTVLLIVGVDSKKDPQTAEEIERGAVHSFSMGAKLPYDECSICKRKSKRRSDYCDHLRFMPNRLMEDGRKVFSYNHEPAFFDISKVTKPAFEGGRTLMKVAHTSESSILSVDLALEYGLTDDINDYRIDNGSNKSLEKYALSIPKFSQHLIDMVEKIASYEEALPSRTLAHLAKEDYPEIWGTFLEAGIIPTPAEFAFIMMMKAGREDLAIKYLGRTCVELDQSASSDLLKAEHSRMLCTSRNYNTQRLAKLFDNDILSKRSVNTLDDRAYSVARMEQKHDECGHAEIGPLLSAMYIELRERMSHYLLPLDKTAKFSTGKAALIGTGILAPYVYSAHVQNKAMQGQPVGMVEQTLANNPGKLAIAGGLLATDPGGWASAAKNAIFKKKQL